MNAEQKQAMIEWLTLQIHRLETACDEIPFGLDADDALLLQAMHATLATLTAQPHHNGMMMLSHKLAVAEAKLAELEKQEPVAYTDAEELKVMEQGTYADMFTPHDSYKSDPQWIPLFTRPAPAINLAELVPGEVTRGNEDVFDVGFANGFNACRAAILHNVELANGSAN
ncbi:hypothetical protein F3I27_12690 [Pantoea sp. Bo_2]|uniref:hypothetical protein n=1 Tax=unclassified Pantoea TaxID=2630326 RepID=UPI001231FD48|nr:MULTISPECIES: hypothetical protein [unclassified Pantoea]KAA5939644.1 hypothetical protein F3I57_18975 [Pantoea sp. VH_3]KAA5948610.1 hypothetical protein F3I56_19565 [Pantoea sp. VH_25]KAA5955434.1 hypothetical protein F3I55_12730 [Pantoea sp. VH_24]KAA5958945.1 hypothetical protein F3I53_13520 [Pantoea sp. VH_16]KAA5964143.1 hypothetical protein F3I54_13360 [Pantoea sp. VH_18]